MSQLVLGGGYDAIDYLQMLETGAPDNRSRWSNADYDAAVKGAAKAETRAKRDALIAKAMAVADRESPIIPVYQLTRNALVRPNLLGYESNPENQHPARWFSWKAP